MRSFLVNQWTVFYKNKSGGAVASRKRPSHFFPLPIAVNVDFIWVKFYAYYYVSADGHAIIGFNHGLLGCVKYLAWAHPVATKPVISLPWAVVP